MRFLLILALLFATTWTAGNLILGALAAPTVFHYAQTHGKELSHPVAGAVFGEIVSTWSTVVSVGLCLPLVLLLAMFSGYALRPRRWAVMSACLVALVGLAVAHAWSVATITEARQIAPPITSTDTYTVEQRAAFNALHYRSERLFITETIIALLVTAGVAIALGQGRENRPSAVNAAS